eukprot:GILJ01000247.1.p1 GENE.GILJ01000247.1~~GILJ01000247.1.p1  ORF type:complete len:335 (-),score=65.66 GILJ01000247.1:165-1169(-)
MKSVVFVCLLLGACLLLAVEAGNPSKRSNKGHKRLEEEEPVISGKAAKFFGVDDGSMVPLDPEERVPTQDTDVVDDEQDIPAPPKPVLSPKAAKFLGVTESDLTAPSSKQHGKAKGKRVPVGKAAKVFGVQDSESGASSSEEDAEVVQQIEDHINECFGRNENPFLCLSVDEINYLLSHETALNKNPVAHFERKQNELIAQLSRVKKGKKGQHLEKSAILRRIASMIASVILYNPSAASAVQTSWSVKQEEIADRIASAVRDKEENVGDYLKFYVSTYTDSGLISSDLTSLFPGRQPTFKQFAREGYRFGLAVMGPETVNSDTGVAVIAFDEGM